MNVGKGAHTGMRVDMCTYMCIDMPGTCPTLVTKLCIRSFIHFARSSVLCHKLCTDKRAGMHTDMCVDMCTDLCVRTYVYGLMCTDMCTAIASLFG